MLVFHCTRPNVIYTNEEWSRSAVLTSPSSPLGQTFVHERLDRARYRRKHDTRLDNGVGRRPAAK